MARTVKNSLAMKETGVQSLDGEEPLEKGTAAQSSILAWRIPRTKELGWLRFHFFTHSLKGPMTSRENS